MTLERQMSISSGGLLASSWWRPPAKPPRTRTLRLRLLLQAPQAPPDRHTGVARKLKRKRTGIDGPGAGIATDHKETITFEHG